MASKIEHIEYAINKTIGRLGYKKLSLDQHKAIVNFVNDQDVFVSLPTFKRAVGEFNNRFLHAGASLT